MADRPLVTAPLLAAVVLGALLGVTGEPPRDGDDRAYAERPVPASATSQRRPTLHVDVAHRARPPRMQARLDRCDGPVAVRFGGIRPLLLAEHDYCGGHWILGLERGTLIRLRGGEVSGTYQASDIKVVAKGTSATVIRGMGDVVAQTCRPDGETVRLVGLSRLD